MRFVLYFILLFCFSQETFGQRHVVHVKLNDTLELILERKPFDPEGRKLGFENGNFLATIDDKPFFGSDGEVPKSELIRATVKTRKSSFQLPVDLMYNPWFKNEPGPETARLIKDGSMLKLQLLLSDGAGTYGTEWLLSKSAGVRSLITQDEDLLTSYFRFYKD